MTGACSAAAHAAAAESAAIGCAGTIGDALIAYPLTPTAAGNVAGAGTGSAIAGPAAVHCSCAGAPPIAGVGAAAIGDVTRACTALLSAYILTRVGLAILQGITPRRAAIPVGYLAV